MFRSTWNGLTLLPLSAMLGAPHATAEARVGRTATAAEQVHFRGLAGELGRLHQTDPVTSETVWKDVAHAVFNPGSSSMSRKTWNGFTLLPLSAILAAPHATAEARVGRTPTAADPITSDAVFNRKEFLYVP